MSLPTIVASLIAVSGGYVYQPSDVSTLKRDDGSHSQPGDILSVQPDGSLQTRPANAVGAWEIMTLSGPYFIYSFDGVKQVLILPPGL